jgi:dephospho-CoA kinase
LTGVKTLALTGGVGMGKSACAILLRDRGIQVIDTDELARTVVEPGQPALAEIQRLFGPEIIDPQGHLRRDVLAGRVFADPAARMRLESIVHPRIRSLWRARIETLRAEGERRAVVSIPLLFETQAEAELDAVICVACSDATQRERLRARGWSDEHIQKRIGAQLPAAEKMAKSNYVIWSEGSLEVHAMQLDRILQRL